MAAAARTRIQHMHAGTASRAVGFLCVLHASMHADTASRAFVTRLEKARDDSQPNCLTIQGVGAKRMRGQSQVLPNGNAIVPG